MEYYNTRHDFTNTWLVETPLHIDPINLSSNLIFNIKDYIQAGVEIIHLSNNLRKMEGNDVCYYWYVDENNNFVLGAEFSKKPQALIVNALAKTNSGSPPYASDLYDAVLKDRKGTTNSIRSDIKITQDGFNVWAQLLKQGHKISVYHPSVNTLITITDVIELKKYFGSDPELENYQFVLTENGIPYADLRSFFNLYSLRKQSGLL